MDHSASPLFSGHQSEASLEELLSALAAHERKLLVIEYAGRRIQPGYHVTEVKAGSFTTLDCGGNPDAWEETILQVEDMPAEEGQTYMTAGKFCSILAKVGVKVRLDGRARLTFEISGPDAPMQVFDVGSVVSDEDQAIIRLNARAAICKPRHREARAQASSCCASPDAGSKVACCS